VLTRPDADGPEAQIDGFLVTTAGNPQTSEPDAAVMPLLGK
jgi:hypothetical protein